MTNNHDQQHSTINHCYLKTKQPASNANLQSIITHMLFVIAIVLLLVVIVVVGYSLLFLLLASVCYCCCLSLCSDKSGSGGAYITFGIALVT